MKVNLALLFFFLSSSLLVSQSKTVRISGKIVDRPLDTLILTKVHEDLRYHGVRIPIRADSTFSYEFTCSEIEEYSLTFLSEWSNGAWRPIYFFSDGEEIEFTLHDGMQFERNSTKGSPLSIQKTAFNEALKDAFQEKMGPAYQALREAGDDPAAKELAQSKVDVLNVEAAKFQHQYFIENPNLLGFNEYVDLLRSAKRRNLTSKDLDIQQAFWLKQFPDHPLAARDINLFAALSGLKIGSPFIDFTVRSSSGEEVAFSEAREKDKVILVDLWAPWCGPCIRKSRKIEENHAVLQARGLSVFSVIGGIDRKEDYVKAVKRFAYPWDSYMEIQDENKIWEKFGISMSGGSQFLYDKGGKLLAVNPSIEELKTHLSK